MKVCYICNTRKEKSKFLYISSNGDKIKIRYCLDCQMNMSNLKQASIQQKHNYDREILVIEKENKYVEFISRITENKIRYAKLSRLKSIATTSVRRKFKKQHQSNLILGCSYYFFEKWIESQFTEGMSWDKLKEIHIDHIIPISSASNYDDAVKLTHWSNFQPLWAADNLAKSDTMPPQEVIDEVNMIYECCKLN